MDSFLILFFSFEIEFSLNLLLIVLYGILLIAFFLLFRSRIKINTKKEQLKEKVRRLDGDKRSFHSENARLKSELSRIEKEKTDLIAKLDKSKEVIASLKKGDIEEDKALTGKKEESIEEEPPSPQVEFNVSVNKSSVSDPVEPIFYLGFPDSENAFYAPEATDSPTDESFYTIKGDVLELFKDAAPDVMNMALNFIENHVKRACIITNSKETYHSKVVMEEPGKVQKDGEDFKIIQKLKVRYD